MTRAPVHLDTVPGGPPRGTVLCRLDELERGQSKALTFGEGSQRFEMFLHRDDDGVVAYENSCPHLYIPLDWQPGRFLSANKTDFICSTHGARFRIRDGYCTAGPCVGSSLRRVIIIIQNGQILSD